MISVRAPLREMNKQRLAAGFSPLKSPCDLSGLIEG
jgi:hypothetical protein